MATKTQHTGTKKTMPYFMWKHDVIVQARVNEADAHKFAGRDRIKRWFDAGEPVWMASDALRAFVQSGKRHERVEHETNYLHDKMKVR